MSEERFTHRRLQPFHIRLLQLEYKDPVLELRCNLRIVDSRKTHTYTTLSYAWDQTEPDGSHLTRYVVCDDQRIKINEGLHAGLRRIRDILQSEWREREAWRNRPRPEWKIVRAAWRVLGFDADPPDDPLIVCNLLWVDQICIDQSNAMEKAAQVELMAYIYSKSSQLIVWLGEIMNEDECERLRYLLQDDPFENKDLVLDYHDLFEVLLQASWFGRRWIVQEVLKSRNGTRLALFGEACVPLEYAAFLCTQADPYGLLATMYDERSGFNSGMDLLGNLLAFDRAACSDPRDCVYSLLNISKDGSDFKVDYSIGMETLFTAVARHCVEAGYLILILTCASNCRQRSHTALSMPSWIPDWRYGQERRRFSGYDRLEVIRKAMSDRKMLATWKYVRINEDGSLLLKGVLFSTSLLRDEPDCPYLLLADQGTGEPTFALQLVACTERISSEKDSTYKLKDVITIDETVESKISGAFTGLGQVIVRIT